MPIDPVTMVLVDLTEVPPTGDATMLLRMHGDGRDMIDTAASIMGMKQGEFLRAAAIGAAKKVITENAR